MMKKYMTWEFLLFFLRNSLSWANTFARACGWVIVIFSIVAAGIAPVLLAIQTGNVWWLSLYLLELALLSLLDSAHQFNRSR